MRIAVGVLVIAMPVRVLVMVMPMHVLLIVMPMHVLVIIVSVIVLRRSGRRIAGGSLLAAHRRLRVAFGVSLGRAARASCAAR